MPKRKRKKSPSRKTAELFIVRLSAVFMSYVFKAIGAGAIIGVSVFKSVLIAGIMGVASTFEYLTRGYINDGKLTKQEVDAAFQKVDAKMDES